MKVGELIKVLKTYPQDIEIFGRPIGNSRVESYMITSHMPIYYRQEEFGFIYRAVFSRNKIVSAKITEPGILIE